MIISGTTAPSGLSEQEASARLRADGANDFRERAAAPSFA